MQLNEGWYFALGAPRDFKPVRIPHDWLISDTSALYQSGTGWYRRQLDASFLDEGKRALLCFDGVYMDSTLYVNGQEVGSWKYGYTAFEFDISDFLHEDRENEILLKVEYQTNSARWYTGAGIYRDVSLRVVHPIHFKTNGIYVSGRKEGSRWVYDVDAELSVPGEAVTIMHRLLGAEDGIKEWDIEHPQLYVLRSEIYKCDELLDRLDTRIGFRSLEFTPDRGFYLNGRKLKFKGVCLHHDLGLLGAAVHPEAIRRQLSILKEMGVNAIRTAHNPPAKVFMELADEMGFLVCSEIFDVWRQAKTENDYAKDFDAWVEKDLASWLRRDRNHPSLIMWSLGNEIPDTHKTPEQGQETLEMLMDLVKLHDPRQNAAMTLCSNYMPWEGTQRSAELIRLIGYNYGESLYDEHHQLHPHWIIYGSETCSTVQSRGVYRFPLEASILSDDDLQCSSLGNSATSWGAKSVEDCILNDLNTPYSLGQFIWAGQDYLGEPTPYHTKNSYLGHIDTAGFPKDSYYLFQAAWTDYRSSPMLHLFPYWDFSPGQIIDVRVASNAPEVELFLNGKSLGRKSLSGSLLANWKVPYEAGEIRALAFDPEGRQLADVRRSSFGETSRLRVEASSYGDELRFFSIQALDSQGNPVENSNRRVRVEVSGGELLGLDNGDARDYEQFHSSSRRLHSGRLLAIVRKTSAEEPELSASLDPVDIPIRKIELEVLELSSGDQSNDLKDRNSRTASHKVRARVFPPNAEAEDIRWRVTEATGIDSPLAEIRPLEGGLEAEIHAKGDGIIWLRCGSGNGARHWDFISQLSLQLDGFGSPKLDPYSYVSGGLYDQSIQELGNGNERGVATLRKGESHVVFRDLDFGTRGSDLIRLDLFPLDKDPFSFEVWDGIPGQGGSRLAELSYDKGSIWNTYQEVQYKLPSRMKGVRTLCLTFRQKVHIKGFCFQNLNTPFRRLGALDCEKIVGDSFEVKGEHVEGIGNNVSLDYGYLEFGSDGAQALRVCYRSRIELNSVQLVLEGQEREVLMLELERGDVKDEYYIEKHIALPARLVGRKRVILLFLPGCSLDLAWLEFLRN